MCSMLAVSAVVRTAWLCMLTVSLPAIPQGTETAPNACSYMRRSEAFNAPNGCARTIKCSYERSGWGFYDLQGDTPSAATSVMTIYETE